MSDAPRGPGWWQATDGRWYAPTPAGGSSPPPPPVTPAERKRQVRRAKALVQVQGLLEPGEAIRAMFVSQTGPSPRGVLSVGVSANAMHYWHTAVTDRNIVLSPVQAFGGKGSKRFLQRLPLAPIEIEEAPSRHQWLPVRIAGIRHWVARESYDDVLAANEALRTPVAPAPPPPPPPPPPFAVRPPPPSPAPPAAAPPPPSPPVSAARPPAPSPRAPASPAPAVGPPPAPPPPPVRSGPAPGWYPDPSGRHQLRYWHGGAWTDDVADGGVRRADPLAAA